MDGFSFSFLPMKTENGDNYTFIDYTQNHGAEEVVMQIL